MQEQEREREREEEVPGVLPTQFSSSELAHLHITMGMVKVNELGGGVWGTKEVAGGKLGLSTASEFNWQTKAASRERERERAAGLPQEKLLWGARCERAKMKRVGNPFCINLT